MKTGSAIFAVLVSGVLALPVIAETGTAPSATAAAESNASTSGFNSTNQYVINPGSQPINSRVDKYGVTCPVAQGAVYGGVQDTKYNGLGHDVDQYHAGVAVTMPIPGEQMRTCKQGQRAVMKILEWESVDAERATHNEIIKHCLSAANEGIWLDPVYFPWAEKCEGVVRVTARNLADLEDENARLRDQLKALMVK